MHRPAHTSVPVHELIARRWSPRGFADRAVSSDAVAALFEAARWAPSCFNEQPWRFVYAAADRAGDHARLASLLNDKNRRWAASAPLLAASIAVTRFAATGAPNRHAWHDVGLAVGNLTAQATALGLGVHQMAGFDRERAGAVLGLPADHEPVAMLAIGYPDASSLPEELAARERGPRQRKPLEAIAFAGRLG